MTPSETRLLAAATLWAGMPDDVKRSMLPVRGDFSEAFIAFEKTIRAAAPPEPSGEVRAEPDDDDWVIAWNRTSDYSTKPAWNYCKDVSALAYKLAAERQAREGKG